MKLSGELEVKRLRVFGFGLGVVALLLAHGARRHGSSLAWGLGLCLGLVLAAAARPAWLLPLYRPWMQVVGVIARINTFVAMAVMYYLVLTPLGALSRALGSDHLDERLRTGESYWRRREPVEGVKAYERQF